jgi:hypothetical protein
MQSCSEFLHKETDEDKESIIDDITKVKDAFYKQNNKNIIFKKDQKNECASFISQQIDCSVLFEKTLFIIKYSEIYFDYTIFKTYIHPEIFDNFLEYVNQISFEYIDRIPEYTLHLNFQSLSISAFERYWPLIVKILNKFPVSGNKMQKTYIYHTPNVVNQIMRVINPFINHFREKIIFFSKSESSEKLTQLLLPLCK